MSDKTIRLQFLLAVDIVVYRRIDDNADICKPHPHAEQIRSILSAEAGLLATKVQGVLQHLDPDLAVKIEFDE